MSTLMTSPILTVPTPVQDSPRPIRWAREEYYQLAEAGFFAGKRVMLIDGEIVLMSPQNEPHVSSINLTGHALEAAFGSGYYVRVQAPLALGQTSDPEPDLAVVSGSPRTTKRCPTTALLVVEVSDTSLAYDTGVKASLYAAGGIADYWVIDLVNGRLLVFRDPRPDLAAAHGHAYFQHLFLQPVDRVAPLAAPSASVLVADLLP